MYTMEHYVEIGYNAHWLCTILYYNVMSITLQCTFNIYIVLAMQVLKNIAVKATFLNWSDKGNSNFY